MHRLLMILLFVFTCILSKKINAQAQYFKDHKLNWDIYIQIKEILNEVDSIFYKLPSDIDSARLFIFDGLGNLVKILNIKKKDNYVVLNRKEFDSGTYYYRISTDTEVSVTRRFKFKTE